MYKDLKKEIIYIDEKDKTDEIQSYVAIQEQDKYSIVFKNSNKSYTYNKNRVRIVKSGLKNKDAKTIFNYFKSLVKTIGIIDENEKNILADNFERISFISEKTILSNYLNGKESNPKISLPISIFPFGFNLSQMEAVNKVFSHSLSVIEGPPGTGKTQTILNIIANAIIKGQNVAVVSSNNSAVKNVYEKLTKNKISFISALLGNSKNKKDFIDSQEEIPDISSFKLPEDEIETIKQKNTSIFEQLQENLIKKNNQALLRNEIENLKTEYKHFKNDVDEIENIIISKKLSSDSLLSLWIQLEELEKSDKKINWLNKIIFRFKYKLKDQKFYKLSYQKMITFVQSKYYSSKISELSIEELKLNDDLQSFNFRNKMEEHTRLSMKLFKHELYKRYYKKQRPIYKEKELWLKSENFIEDYPVIMSTSYSLTRSLSNKILYDFVIVDESSQVDLATGILAMSCAKKAVIVGDLKQLPNVINSDIQKKAENIFQSFNIPEYYNYANHSLLSSIVSLFPKIPKTLLREHYRCHPKIINFCNKKFYNDELIILSESNSNKVPLYVYKTVPGNHARKNINQRQIDVITEEIIPNLHLENVDLGIVTPYRKQTEALQNEFKETSILADTVDKFQGRENNVIILSTVDNYISEFSDDSNRLNVAVSRAKEQLIVLVHGNEGDNDSNISDLIRYIHYNNSDSIIKSKITSIFDYLYKQYEEKRKEILLSKDKKSLFDSENLMYKLIKDVFTESNFSKYDMILNFPLRNLLLDFSKLTEIEKRYAQHHSTHIDFLIYNKLGKNPVLAIEVDGYEFHKEGTRQAKRDQMKNIILDKYGIPIIRFSTTGSQEREKLINKLNNISN